jgi:hypothetical protein
MSIIEFWIAFLDDFLEVWDWEAFPKGAARRRAAVVTYFGTGLGRKQAPLVTYFRTSLERALVVTGAEEPAA